MNLYVEYFLKQNLFHEFLYWIYVDLTYNTVCTVLI